MYSRAFTGITPSLHINLIVPLFLLLTLPLSPIFLIVFIVSLSITHTFIDFIPSIFLGAPSEDTSLSILPGHSLLLQGQAQKALVFSISGCFLGIILSLILTPVFILLMPILYSYLKNIMFFILLFTLSYLIARENKKLISLFIFLLAGFLGLASLNLANNSLLPLLTGLFGASSLIISLKDKNQIPNQEAKKFKELLPKFKEIKLSILASALSSPLCALLPALGSNQAAVIASDIVEEKNQTSFLFMIGAINTLMLVLSFVTLYSINKTRTGSAVFISSLSLVTPKILIIILLSALVSGILAFFLSLSLSKLFAKNIPKINYSFLSLIILIFISLIVLLFSGFLGLLIYVTASFIGISCILLNARRTNLMGSLMLPTIIYYLPF